MGARQIGGYRTERLLGRGGSAAVWSATAPDGSACALKVIDGPVDAALQAAKREVAVVVGIDHPHLIRIREVVCGAGAVGIAMDLAIGGSLADLLGRRGRLTAGETLTVLIPIAAALATAHERGLVHGDLSPANIVFDGQGRPLLTDLGAGRAAVDCGLPVTVTPGYVAPEVAKGDAVTPEADVFALGAVGLHCLSGGPAWNADDLRDVVVQATVGQWPDPDDGDGPPALLALLRAALDDPPRRRPGAASLMLDLSRAGEPEPVDLSAGGGRDSGIDGDVGSADGVPDPGRRRGSGAHRAAEIAPTAVRPDQIDTADVDAGGEPSSPGRPRRRWWRIAAVAAAAVLLGGAAVQGGLWWARADSPSGSHAPAAAPGTAATSGVATGSTAARGVATTTGRRSAVASSSVYRPPTRPQPATAAGGSAPRPATHDAGAGSSTTATPTRATDTEGATVHRRWLTVVRRLDRARARAFVQRDPDLLELVYVVPSASASADRHRILALRESGRRVDGAAHRVRRVRVVGTGTRVRLRVTDSLPSYRVFAGNGDQIGSTKPRGAASRVLELVDTDAGYRIASIRGA